MKDWHMNARSIKETLDLLSVRDSFRDEMPPDAAFDRLKDATIQVRNEKRTVYLIGNGASASMASHVAADLAKNAIIHTEILSDLSLITAIANDISYEEVFAEPLRRRMVKGDMLIAISSSGRSPNIIRASREAIRFGGMVITLSAMDPENALRSLGMLNFYVPADAYGMAETCHAAILHYWIDQMVLTTTQPGNEQSID